MYSRNRTRHRLHGVRRFVPILAPPAWYVVVGRRDSDRSRGVPGDKLLIA